MQPMEKFPSIRLARCDLKQFENEPPIGSEVTLMTDSPSDTPTTPNRVIEKEAYAEAQEAAEQPQVSTEYEAGVVQQRKADPREDVDANTTQQIQKHHDVIQEVNQPHE